MVLLPFHGERRSRWIPVAPALLISALVVALPVKTAMAATITVNETVETATFNPPGPVSTSVITSVTNNNGSCSLREAIEAANTNAAVDGCAAGAAGVDTIVLPAGTYVADDNFLVAEPVNVVGANAGVAGYDPARGAESIVQMRFNPNWLAQIGLFWLHATGGVGAAGAGSTFDGVVLEGTPEPTCGGLGTPLGHVPCQSTAIVQPAQGADVAAPGFVVRNSVVSGFSFGVYLGGTAGIIERNLFFGNDSFIGAGATAAVGVDIYSDLVFPTHDTVIQENWFDQPAVAAIDFEGLETGQVIQRNVITMVETQAGAGGIYLFGAQNVTVFDNVLLNLTSPPVGRRGIRISNSQDLLLSGNTFVGLQNGVDVRNFVPGFDVASGIVIANNRIYGNLRGIDVNPADVLGAGAIVANGNWWGANGGPGSTGARPGAPNPVNGIVLTDSEGIVVPNTGQVVVAQSLQLTCTAASSDLLVGQSTSVTGAVSGMPTVDLPEIAQPVMDAAVSGGIGTVSGFGVVPSNGVLGGQLLAGATLTGTFAATTAGSGAVDVALDSEQVACPLTVSLPATTTTVAPTTTTVAATTTTIAGAGPGTPTTTIAPAGVLPPTGSDDRSALYVALSVLALGAMVVAATRRRASGS